MKKLNKLYFFFLIFPLFSYGQKDVDSMRKIITKNRRDTAYFTTLYRLGVEHERTDSKQAMYFLKKSINESQTTDQWTAYALIRLAGIYSSIGKIDSADYYFNLSSFFMKENPDELKVKQQYYTGLGIHNNRVGNNWEALRNYEEVSKIDVNVLGKQNLAGNYLNISNVYHRLGMVDERIEAIFKSLEIFEEIQNQTGLSFCYNALGNLFYDQKEYKKAESWYGKSLELRRTLDDKKGEASALNNLGNVMMDTNRFKEALNYFNRAKEINETFGFRELVSQNLINAGMVYRKMNDLDNALASFSEAKKITDGLSGQPYKALVLAEIGNIHSQKGKNQDAENFLKEAIGTAETKNDLDGMGRAYGFLTKHYEKTGNYKKAYEYQNLLFTVKDSLENNDLKMKIKNLEGKYEFDKKETEINLLRTEKELNQLAIERQRARQTVFLIILILIIIIAFLLINRYRLINREKRHREMEKMRLGIAQDLHDDIGSTLSGIQIISQMALKNGRDPQSEYFSKISAQAGTMMEKLGDIVWSLKADENSQEDLLMKMKEFAGEILEPAGIDYIFEGEENLLNLKLDIEKRKNIFLIFKEAVNNAVKYSDASEVRIHFSLHQNKFKMIIKDNGKGFVPEEIKKGNGLHHIRQRAEKIQAAIAINTQKNNGTEIQLEIPLT